VRRSAAQGRAPGEADFDVAIVGGGLAGACLALQLARNVPRARVALFERERESGYKVGESLVEIASSFLVRRLGLASYLYEQHLPKNGLRYFFDDPRRASALHEMSEIGTVNLPFHPGFQIDRSRFERDVLERARAAGVRVRRGVAVRRIEPGRGGEPHRFEAHAGGRAARHSARWLVDAAGRRGLLARQLGLRVAEPEHRLGSVWGRFEGVADIDAQGPEAWRARVRHTPRRLSTLHFWYPGYWVWFIPLRGGLTSIGATGHGIAARRELRTPDGFRAFLDSHRAIRELLRDAKNVDQGFLTRIAYGTRRFLSPDRWALVGEAASAADPLYSPGSDFIALECDFVSDLVRRELEGEAAPALAERLELYDGFLRFRHEATMRLYRGLYGTQGSYELARAKWDFDIGCYYDLWVHAYLRDEHLDVAWLRRQLRQQPAVLRALSAFAELFRGAETALRARGDYHRENLGHFYYGLTHIDFTEAVGTARSRREVLETLERLFNGVRAQALALAAGDGESADVAPLPLSAYLLGRPLA
jgi:flavin-dependent dehydrogenase